MSLIRPIVIRIAAVSVLAAIFSISSYSQFTISLPKLPKIKKSTSKPEPANPTTEGGGSSTPSSGDSNSEAAKPSPSQCSNSGFVLSHLDSIEKTRKEAEEYRPGLRNYYVSTLSDRKNQYLEAALLPGQRRAWYTDSNVPPEMQKCLDPALDRLAETAKKTLPSFTGPSGYTLGTPAEKKVLLTAINDLAKATVLKSGLSDPNWLIDKDDYNLPTDRFKHGYVMAKYLDTEQNYCWLFWINIVQDYSGGGTYAASHGSFVGRSLVDCPTGK